MPLRVIRSAPSGPEVEVWEGPLPPPVANSWESVLANGVNSGPYSPIVDVGQNLTVSRIRSNPGQFFQVITPDGQPRATTYLQFVTGVGPDGSGDLDLSAGSLLAPGRRGLGSLDWGELSLLATNDPNDTNPTKGRVIVQAGNNNAQPGGSLELRSEAVDGQISAVLNGVLALAFNTTTPANLTAAIVGQALKKAVGNILTYGDIAVNYTFGSYAELAATFPPVAGVITLPTGVYSFLGLIDFPPGETVTLAPAASVMLMCRAIGTSGRLQGTAAGTFFTVPTNCSITLINVGCRNLGAGMGMDVAVNCSPKFLFADIRSTSGQAFRCASFLLSLGSRYVGLTSSLETSSEVWCVADNVIGGTTGAVVLTGSAAMRIFCAEVQGGVGGAALLAGGTGYFYSYGVRWNNANNGAPCVNLTGAGGFRFDQGEIINAPAAPNAGVRIAANVALQMQAVRFAQVSAGVLYASGTVDQAKIVNCDFSSTAAQGINWPAANIPTRGLIEMGNTFNMAAAAAFVGHTQLDARVMRRSNGLAAGVWASETPLVP